MYFSFNGQVFRRKESLPIGSNIPGILAILSMDRLETIALSSHLSIRPYRRYVDYIYLQTTGTEMADQFHHTMSNLHPNFMFEIERPELTTNGLSLSLLHFQVTMHPQRRQKLFRSLQKTAKKPLFFHALPINSTKKSKTNFIRNERNRIEGKLNQEGKLSPEPPERHLTSHHRMAVPEDPIYFRTTQLQDHLHFPKGGYTSTCHAQVLHSQISSLSQQHKIIYTRAKCPSPAPNCTYHATLFIKSRVTTATNTTSGALHALSEIVLRNT